MGRRMAISLALLIGLMAVGCEVTLDQGQGRPYPPPGPGPYPPPHLGPPPLPRPEGRVTGTVTYFAPGGLDRDAVLAIELFEVRRMGGLGRRLGQETIRPVGRSPVPFRINYDGRYVERDLDYVLIAGIRVHGHAIFENAGAYPVITKGRPSYAEIRLERVGGPPHAGGPPPHRHRIAGVIRYGPWMALPPGTVLYIELRTIGRPERTVHRQIVRAPGRPPLKFDMDLGPDEVGEDQDYLVVARIEGDGRTLYEMPEGRRISMQKVPESLELDLRPVEPAAPAVAAGPITGTVSWPRRREMPDGAILQVELWDAAHVQDRRGRLVQHELTHLGRPPVAFKLAYDRRRIDPAADYVVLARIVVGGRVVLRTGDTYGVITKGRPTTAKIVLEGAGAGGG
jgi:uncharacterized lipoprotein YbaY